MFDAELIRACAQLYPAEFFNLCALLAVVIPIGAIVMMALAIILAEG